MDADRRYRADSTVRRCGPGGRTMIGGSPLRLFRLGLGGAALLDRSIGSGVSDLSAAEAALLDRFVDAGLLHPILPDPTVSGADDATVLSVVIPVRDHAAQLGRLLASLGRSRVRPDRTVVVDDASRDAVAVEHAVDQGRAGGLQVELIRRDRSGGPAAARNDGMARVNTALVACLDADCVVEPTTLTRLIGHFEDPLVALVAPRVRAIEGGSVLGRYESERSPLDLGDEPARVSPGTRVSYVPSAAIVVRRTVVGESGGFDPSLRVGEDVDLVWRLISAGHRVRYEPGSVVHHEVRGDLCSWLRQRMSYGSSAGPLARRHPGSVAPVMCSPWSAAVVGLVASGRPMSAAAVAVGTTVQLGRKLRGVSAAEVVRLGLLGHLGAGRQFASAALRDWWPLTVALATVSRRARRLALAALVARMAADLVEQRRLAPLEMARFALLARADDLAYGAGVWLGCWRERSLQAIVPRFTVGSAGTARTAARARQPDSSVQRRAGLKVRVPTGR